MLKRLSIKARIILATTVVLSLVFAGFSVVIYQKAKSAYYGRLDAHLVEYAEKIRGEVEEQYYEKRFPDTTDFRDLKAEGLAGSFVRLTDEHGEVIFADSMLAGQGFKPWDAIKTGRFTFEDVAVGEDRYRSLWARVEVEDRDRYAMQVVVPLTEVEAAVQLLLLLFLLGVPIALAVSAGAVYGIVSTAFQPLSEMIRTADKISATNLSERVPLPKSHDEVFALTSTMNTMMERIEQAFKSQKQFIADASHEIRTPLAIMRSELEFAQKHLSESLSQESLEAALEEVDRLKRLSDDLLLLAKLESPAATLKDVPVRLDEVLADCVMRMKPVAEKENVGLQLEISEAIEIRGDEDRLKGAVLNLVDNAIKYSSAGGTVTITLSNDKRSVSVSVRDEGDGIAAEDQDKIFERFHRSESKRSRHDGNGLGLAIVRRIVELHNGTIAVVSQLGKGSTFTIEFPRIEHDQTD